MSEKDVIEATKGLPVTVDSLAEDMNRIGIEPGAVLFIHCSLSSIGWVVGGPVAVILALEKVVGQDGTIVMPGFTGSLSDPTNWSRPPVPKSWVPVIKESMPAYRKDITPTRIMGAVAETFRKIDGVLRSNHPQVSFCAKGPKAREITSDHPLHFGHGDESPLGHMYKLDGKVLMLGTTYETCTSMHLAEYHAYGENPIISVNGAPIFVDGKREWVDIREPECHDEFFAVIGAEFDKSGDSLRRGKIGQAESRYFGIRDVVDFSERWMRENRPEIYVTGSD